MTHLSPFIEGTNIQYAWDSTSLGWLKECPYKYYLHMIEGWRAKGEQVHLDFGIFYHRALEEYDRFRALGGDHEEGVLAAVSTAMLDTWINGKPWRLSKNLDMHDKTSVKCRENLIRTIVWYLDKFKDDPAKTVVRDGQPLVEQHFQLDLDFGPLDLSKEGHPYVLCGYLDRVVTFQDLPFVMDRKTTATTLSDYYFSRFDPDNQMSFYTAAAQVLFKNPIKGVIVDAAQVAVGFSAFQRKIISKSPDQIDEWMEDLKYWLETAVGYATRDYWPRNDKSCAFCTFRPICQKSPSVRQKFLESDYEKHHWNPLVPR